MRILGKISFADRTGSAGRPAPCRPPTYTVMSGWHAASVAWLWGFKEHDKAYRRVIHAQSGLSVAYSIEPITYLRWLITSR